MPVTLTGSAAALPRSHCFISLAHGTTIRTVRVRTGLLRSGLAVAALLAVWLVGSTLYLLFHDDLLASVMTREAQMQYAYEDRIAALRGQVEHESSLKLVTQSTLESQVRDLARRAASLEIRATLVSELAGKLGGGKGAGRPGRPPAPVMTSAADPLSRDGVDNPIEGEPAGSVAPEAGSLAPAASSAVPPRLPKPRPEAFLDRPADGGLEAKADDDQPLRLRLATVTEALEHVDAAQYARLASIGTRARQRVDTIRAALASAGLSSERVAARDVPTAVGGPFVPLDPAIERSPFGKAVDALQADVAAAETLTRALPRLPFAKPMEGGIEITSPFGARLDPFLGRPAMHTGVDLREELGSDVRATANGRVVSAGPAGGYGVMVEIDHGHGLSTRYAHLSAVTVEPGQSVARGEVVGRVGMTGRATGPHLHYETRIDGEAVDPVRFLVAGAKMAALDPAF